MINPIGDRCTIKVLKTEKKTSGGIYIPETSVEKTEKGIVVAVSDTFSYSDVKVGTKVIFDKYSGSLIKGSKYSDEDDLLVISSDSIIAIMEDDDE